LIDLGVGYLMIREVAAGIISVAVCLVAIWQQATR
jgi:hypothetical protein